MINHIFHNIKWVALAVAIFALGACSSSPMKAYTGPTMPADQTALIVSGPYTDLESVDGVKVSSLSATVLPGKHTVGMRPSEYGTTYPGYVGPYYFYSRVTGSVEFAAEAGHRYVAWVRMGPGPATEELTGSGFEWRGYVEDQTTNRNLVRTAALPLEAEPVPPYGGGGGVEVPMHLH